jgi:hypothetical protein
MRLACPKCGKINSHPRQINCMSCKARLFCLSCSGSGLTNHYGSGEPIDCPICGGSGYRRTELKP